MQRRAGQAILRPVVQRLGTDAPVEVDGRFIPVQYRPFQASAAALHGQARQLAEQGAAEPHAAGAGAHIEIFEIDTGFAKEGRVVVEEQGKARRRAIDLTDQYFGKGACSEQVFGHVCRVGYYLIAELLVLGQFADKAHDQRNIVTLGTADVQEGHGRSLSCWSGEHAVWPWGLARGVHAIGCGCETIECQRKQVASDVRRSSPVLKPDGATRHVSVALVPDSNVSPGVARSSRESRSRPSCTVARWPPPGHWPRHYRSAHRSPQRRCRSASG